MSPFSLPPAVLTLAATCGLLLAQEHPAKRPGGSFPSAEQAVEQEARRFVASEIFRRQHPQKNTEHAVMGTSLIQHPLLANALPKFRFYFAHIRSRTIERVDGKSVVSNGIRVYLALVDTNTLAARLCDSARDAGEAWRFDPLKFLAEQLPGVRSREDVARWDATYRVVQRIAASAFQPCTQTRTHAEPDWLRKTFGLGVPTPLPPGVEPATRIVATKTHWVIVEPSVSSDDWNLPVQACFRLLRFARTDGAFVDVGHAKGASWPAERMSKAAFSEEIDRFCKQLAEQD